jgi:hypothetical protein
MTDKLFSVAGVSTQNGETKARFANDVMRVKVLRKNGHTNITLIELPNEMTKLQAAEFIRDLPEFQSGDAQAAIDEAIGKRAPRASVQRQPHQKAKVERKPKSKAKNLLERGVEILNLTDEDLKRVPKDVLERLENAPF